MKQNREPIALSQMAEQFRREIFTYIQTRVGDRCAADDLTQETFLKVQNALAKGTEPEHLRGWLFQIARNAVIDFFKKAPRFVPFEEEHVVSKAKTQFLLTTNFVNAFSLTLSVSLKPFRPLLRRVSMFQTRPNVSLTRHS
jgi:RNA polymerase sigma factor (sigma-70 family)